MIHKFPIDIIGGIALHANQDDVLSLMRVNKWLYKVLKPQLYSNIIFDFDKTKLRNPGKTKLTKLKSMNKLLKSPNVRLIRSLNLKGYLVKNLSRSKLFKKFLRRFEEFMFFENRLISFINSSTIIDTSFKLNLEIQDMLEDVPINLLQEYKFPNLHNLTVSESSELLHLSKISISMLTRDLFFEITTDFLLNLKNLFINKSSINLVIDIGMINFLNEQKINNIKLTSFKINLIGTSSTDISTLVEVFLFNEISNLEITCNNDEMKNVILDALDRKNFKNFIINSKNESKVKI